MGSLQISKVEALVAQDQKFISTLTSYSLVLIIYANLNILQSSVLGVAASILYFLINGIFLGRAFFEKEDTFFRLMLGLLLFIMLLGFVGWFAVIIYNLNATMSSLVLFVVATICSLINRKVNHKKCHSASKG